MEQERVNIARSVFEIRPLWAPSLDGRLISTLMFVSTRNLTGSSSGAFMPQKFRNASRPGSHQKSAIPIRALRSTPSLALELRCRTESAEGGFGPSSGCRGDAERFILHCSTRGDIAGVILRGALRRSCAGVGSRAKAAVSGARGTGGTRPSPGRCEPALHCRAQSDDHQDDRTRSPG